MARQNVERREILRIVTIAAGVAAFPGFSKWTFACGHPAEAFAQVKPASYTPVFFNATEYALVELLCALIIPSDETPGAREAGVAEFVDLMVSRDAALQPRFRAGLRWLEAHSRKLRGKPFASLAPEQQITTLESLAYKRKFRPGEEPGREFFDLIREYAVMGFYTSEVGLKQLDFPGLQFYAESPACPHKDDPEHRHLPPPRF